MTSSSAMKRVEDDLKFIQENMVTKKDLNSLLETVEILTNAETMMQLAKSAEDKKAGRVQDFPSVKALKHG